MLSDAESLRDLEWAHATLMRLIAVVQRNGFVGERLSECVVEMSKGAVLLEGLVQEQLVNARRRRDD